MKYGMPADEIGFSGNFIDRVDQLPETCAMLGIDHVLLNTPVKDDGSADVDALVALKEAVVKTGVNPYAGWKFFGMPNEGDFTDPAVREKTKAAFINQIRAYGKAGLSPMTVFSGVKPGDDVEAAWCLSTDFLKELVAEAENAGIVLALHNLNDTMSCFNRAATFERLFEEIPSKALAICYDAAIHTKLGDDVPATMKKFYEMGRMPLMHIRTVENPIPPKDFDAVEGKLVPAEASQFPVDFKAIMKTLMDIDYQGIVGIEHQKKMEEWCLSIGYVKGVVAGIG